MAELECKMCQIILPVSSAFEFFSGYGRDMSVWVASAVSFLCAVKRDKGGRASADDSSKEERVRGHDAASLCQGLIIDGTVSAYD